MTSTPPAAVHTLTRVPAAAGRHRSCSIRSMRRAHLHHTGTEKDDEHDMHHGDGLLCKCSSLPQSELARLLICPLGCWLLVSI